MEEQPEIPQTKQDTADRPQPVQGQQTQPGTAKPDEWQSSTAMQPPEERGERSPATNGEPGGRQRGMSRRDWFTPPTWAESPFAVMRRFSDEMDRMVDRFREEFGAGRGWLGSRFGGGRELSQRLWSPQIEVCERDNQLLVCADLPGLKKEDIKVEFTDNALTIQGERRQEHEETHEGHHTSERSYGTFYRSIPLPAGVNPENAKATFQDGVLKITMPLPQRAAQRSRRIEIQGAESQPSSDQPKMSEQTPVQQSSN
jgi:HSP20 family protein